MTARRYAWRAGGIALFACAGALHAAPGGVGAFYALLRFLFAVAGVVLLVQGRRVPLALRVERSRHRNLPNAIHAGRMARHAAQARARDGYEEQ